MPTIRDDGRLDESPIAGGSPLSPEQHRALWMQRYGDYYATDAERCAAYDTHQATLAMMREVFFPAEVPGP